MKKVILCIILVVLEILMVMNLRAGGFDLGHKFNLDFSLTTFALTAVNSFIDGSIRLFGIAMFIGCISVVSWFTGMCLITLVYRKWRKVYEREKQDKNALLIRFFIPTVVGVISLWLMVSFILNGYYI